MSFKARCRPLRQHPKSAFAQVSMIEVQRWDWPHSQFVCLRLFPVTRPQSFTKRIRCLIGGWKCYNVVAALETPAKAITTL